MSVWATTLAQATGAFAPDPQGPGPEKAALRYMPGAPEIYFSKPIDNSRVVKVADPRRRREMRVFTGALAVFFVLVMVYLWQHLSAIEYGYNIEALHAQRDSLVEANRALKLEEASLRDPERIDAIAKSMGLRMPQAGQVQAMDATEQGGPVMARAAGISVVSVPN